MVLILIPWNFTRCWSIDSSFTSSRGTMWQLMKSESLAHMRAARSRTITGTSLTFGQLSQRVSTQRMVICWTSSIHVKRRDQHLEKLFFNLRNGWKQLKDIITLLQIRIFFLQWICSNFLKWVLNQHVLANPTVQHSFGRMDWPKKIPNGYTRVPSSQTLLYVQITEKNLNLQQLCVLQRMTRAGLKLKRGEMYWKYMSWWVVLILINKFFHFVQHAIQ